MQNQTVRLFLYSSLAIVALTLVWGLRSIPRQGHLAEDQLRNSLEQELVVLSSAVRATTSALKFRLLDVLKAEGNDHPTRAFQESPFTAAALLEWDGSTWKVNWHSTKMKEDFQVAQLRNWMRDWPLAKITASDETYFTKLNDVGGQPFFAMVVPVRKPGDVPLLGLGIFPAAQYGLSFAADESREVNVFDDKGFALALAHPAYVGASLKREPIVSEILDGDSLSLREEWKSEAGIPMLGLAQRQSDSNLYAAVETKLPLGRSWYVQAWLYLVLCGLGAIVINWALFANLVKPLFEQLAQTEEYVETLRKQMSERATTIPLPALPAEPKVADRAIPVAELPQVDFIEKPADAPPGLALGKVVAAALRNLETRVREAGISVNKVGLDEVIIDADVIQLQTAIEEVLKNAVEAMQDSKERQLTITAYGDRKRIQLLIEDTGSGIASENLKKVFDPFFSTKDTQGVSRGLGLNVVRRVVEELQGSIDVRNRGGAKGTIVEMEWPREREESTTVVVETSQPNNPDFNFLDDELNEDFAALSVPKARKNFPEVAIRKPKVRVLD
jgi:anti-sigma regulatory factor (Ser/Thr protein kinase)